MRYMYFTAFAICGIALYLWIETWAQAHRRAFQRLLEESEKTRATIEAEDTAAVAWSNNGKD